MLQVGLVPIATDLEETTEAEPGKVFKQSIEPGKSVKEGTRVKFTTAMAPSTIGVPNVVGMAAADAETAIEDADLGFDSTQEYNDSVDAGLVIYQAIDPGTQVKAGTIVSVSISLGPAPEVDVTVPDVLTYSWSEAEHVLESAGLQARYTGDPTGVVVAQNYEAGTTLPSGEVVTVTLASNPDMVTVPNLVGMSVTSAENATDAMGLGLDLNGGGLHGTVVSQWPNAGNEVEAGTTVQVTVDDSDFK